VVEGLELVRVEGKTSADKFFSELVTPFSKYKQLGPSGHPYGWHPYFGVASGGGWSHDLESYACSSVATRRTFLAGRVKGDDRD
jgi:hypothetical protein